MRTLGREGLRVAAAASGQHCSGLATRYASTRLYLPDPARDLSAYAERILRWLGAFAPGTRDLYLFVDSWNPGVPHGAVLEKDEANNRSEFHGAPISMAHAPSSGEGAPFDPWSPEAMPARPARLEE